MSDGGVVYLVLTAVLIIVPRVLAKRWAARYNKYKPVGPDGRRLYDKGV